MKTIVLKNGYFGKKPAIRLEFPFDLELKELVKTYPGCQWDPKQKVWWVLYTDDQFNGILRFFKGKAGLDYSQFHLSKPITSNPELPPLTEVIAGEIKNFEDWMLSLIYACGLRRSEVLNLKPTDVDSKRGILVIRQAKGKKDRITPLSGKLVELLRQYYVAFKPYAWLFEGQTKGEQYSAESLQSVLKQALRKTGIQKPVTLHWLRHN